MPLGKLPNGILNYKLKFILFYKKAALNRAAIF